MLDNTNWVEMLEDVARTQAGREEEAARKMQNSKWLAWLHDGRAAGLGRQHRMTRTAIGWNPIADASGDSSTTPQLGEQDGVDGLSDQQLESIEVHRTESGRPRQCSAGGRR